MVGVGPARAPPRPVAALTPTRPTVLHRHAHPGPETRAAVRPPLAGLAGRRPGAGCAPCPPDVHRPHLGREARHPPAPCGAPAPSTYGPTEENPIDTAPTPSASAATDAYALTHKTDDEANETWLLLHDGDLLIAFVDIVDRGFELWITDIAVHPDYRGRGLASRLLNAVIHGNPGSDIALSCCAITVDLWEWPQGVAGLPTEALAAWYARYGFGPAPHENAKDRMARVS
ncbi:GNAT family N-acetyltransferase [Streptomyces sp. NPDC058256]|uniref:GNAT family N-acetyltransferase n=1 Tax=Streptomyces sp. NPDC058256 TaxID=3346408 RepID=UPI0036E7AD4A